MCLYCNNIIGDERLPPNITRYGVFAVVNNVDELSQHITDILQALPQYNSDKKTSDTSKTTAGPVNVLHIALLNYSDDTDTSGGSSSGTINDEAISSKLSSLLSSHAKDLLQADVRRVTFLVGTKQVCATYANILHSITYQSCNTKSRRMHMSAAVRYCNL